MQERDAAETNALLDESVDDPTLGNWFPLLQASVTIDDGGVRRLHRALALGIAPIGRFMNLAYGRACEPISGPAFRDLMLAIDAKPGGNLIAREILSMRLHSDGSANRKPLAETVEAGRQLLANYAFARREQGADHDDYRLGVTARACLGGPEGEPVARKMVRDLKSALQTYEVYAWEQDDLLRGLFKAQPIATLDELVAGSDKDRAKSIELFRDAMRHRQNPANVVDDDLLLEWCERDPALRYPFAAGVALLFSRPNDQSPHEWLPIAATLLRRTPDAVAVFKVMGVRLWPTSFSGSVASKYESRVQLLDKLEIGDDPALVAAVAELRAKLLDRVEKERRSELEEDLAQSGRFE